MTQRMDGMGPHGHGRRNNPYRESDDLLNSFFNADWVGAVLRDFGRECKVESFPPANISTNKEGTIKFELALAGYSEEDIKLSAEADKLTISSEKKEDKDEDIVYLHKGIRGRKFSVTYSLNAKFDISKTKAKFANGILTITIPVAEEKKPRDIKIEL